VDVGRTLTFGSFRKSLNQYLRNASQFEAVVFAFDFVTKLPYFSGEGVPIDL